MLFGSEFVKIVPPDKNYLYGLNIIPHFELYKPTVFESKRLRGKTI